MRPYPKQGENVQIYISIDDTDNIDSPGSGQLSQALAEELQKHSLTTFCSTITRHQLYFHDSIPYTSHNSAMCFSAVTEDGIVDDLIRFAGRFLQQTSAPGSDPGLCVAAERTSFQQRAIIDFGLRAKKEVLSKDEAYSLANVAGIHLSEHGGTGDGVIGALAGIGLRMSGNDGRFRGWLNFGKAGETIEVKQLYSHPDIQAVVTDDGTALPDTSYLTLADDRIKTVMLGHLQVVPVTEKNIGAETVWTTLNKRQVKQF